MSGVDKVPSVSTKDASDEGDDHNHGHGPMENGCFGKGIVQDLKRTVFTHWKSEMTNFNQKTIAVSFFIFFAAVSPAITFGAIYAKATHNWIGAMEMIVATAWCGIVYALIGGQPMMINGGTGPVLAFTAIIYNMSEAMDVPFLTFNCWVGIWVSVYMFLAAVFDLNRIIVYATRFTDEIFALLISAIFIINALGNPFGDTGLYHYFKEDHKSHAYYASDPDYNHLSVALLSTFLCIGTVQVAASLKRTKFTSYYPTQGIRNTITDFSVVLAIALWTFVDKVVFPTIKTESLNVPAGFNPTYACCYDDCSLGNFPDDCPDLDKEAGFRPWLVDLTDLGGKPWLPFMAAGPALLAFILVFLDDGITWHLINHPSHKITHGAAYNWDTVVIGIMTLVNSLLGLPWLVAATVRSLNHVHALAEKTPDGKIQSVLETRLTHLGIHVLVLASIFALDLLKVIPMPVLYGVFLFMGIVSLGTNSFYNRFTMFFMQPEKYPMEPYTQYVKPSKMHLFTIIQLVLFVTLYVVKTIKAIAIAFPIVIALCIPVRVYVLTKIFTKEELIMIDSDEETIKRYLEKNEATPPEEEVSEKEKDIEKQDDDAAKENEDQVSGLPPLNMRRQPRKRSNFHKSLSAPQHSQANALFFGKVHDMPANEAEPLVQQELERRQRVRQESDPHMLLAEAERMISKDYRFG